jgi:hypothetical protein
MPVASCGLPTRPDTSAINPIATKLLRRNIRPSVPGTSNRFSAGASHLLGGALLDTKL